jgi:trehalose 6-phosphate phosphatase
MQHLFDPDGRRALKAALRAEPLLAFDFDGTLAPIVERPDDARVAVEASERLDALARLRPVAIVTGRSVADVSHRLGFTPRYVVGNHGAEDPERTSELDVSVLDDWRAQLAARAAELHANGIQVEDKRLSLALHYRQAHDPPRALAFIENLLAQVDPRLRVFSGKCVVNLVLAAAPDKADAVASLVTRAGCDVAIFVGDDINDEVVFACAPPEWLTVRVGRDDASSRAEFFLDGHAEVQVLLDEMLRALSSP